jgi:hypothetical protein
MHVMELLRSAGVRPGKRWVFSVLLVIAGLIFAGLSAAAPAHAQGGTPAPQIDNAELRLWPEYDDPGLLIIFDGTFVTNTAKFPVTVSFPLSGTPRGIQATERTATGELLSQPWQINGDRLTYSLPGPSFQMEYYNDRSAAANGQRTIEYSFKAPYAIRQLTIDVAQPARSTDFSVTPTAQSGAPASDGLMHYALQRTNVAAGEMLAFTIRYTKSDNQPSFAPPSAASATTAASTANNSASAAQATASGGAPGWLPWLLIGLGALALVAATAYYLWQQQQTAHQRVRHSTPPRQTTAHKQPLPARRSTPGAGVRAMSAPGRGTTGRPPAAEGTAAAPTSAGPVTFCPRCGHPFKPGDQFCAQCGAPRRQ